MDDDNLVLELENISFSSFEAKVLKDISLSIKKNERVGIIGANGSGKTTLLQIIMGLYPISGGKLRIFGKDMEKEKDFEEIRPRLGYVFQNADDQLFSPTVLEDVAFGPLNLGKTPDEAKEIALSTLKDLNLEGFENRISYRLSGGEKRLVALATVFSMNPDALLLDEPTTGLDRDTQEHIVDILNNCGKTLVMVSHEYEFLHKTTDKYYGIENGRIMYNGESSALHTHSHMHSLGRFPHEH